MISVLIVDDNHSFTDSLKVILKDITQVSFTKSVSNFTRAQKELESTKYNLIIIENDSEVSMKGIDFIHDYLKNHKGLSMDNFILLSSKTKELSERSKQEKVPFFRKPLNINEFKEYILKTFQEKTLKSGTE
jgi:two-component SAPR family response regulator